MSLFSTVRWTNFWLQICREGIRCWSSYDQSVVPPNFFQWVFFSTTVSLTLRISSSFSSPDLTLCGGCSWFRSHRATGLAWSWNFEWLLGEKSLCHWWSLCHRTWIRCRYEDSHRKWLFLWDLWSKFLYWYCNIVGGGCRSQRFAMCSILSSCGHDWPQHYCYKGKSCFEFCCNVIRTGI